MPRPGRPGGSRLTAGAPPQVRALREDLKLKMAAPVGGGTPAAPYTVTRQLNMNTTEALDSPAAAGAAPGPAAAAASVAAGQAAALGLRNVTSDLVSVLRDEVKKLGLRLEQSMRSHREIEIEAKRKQMLLEDEIAALKLENTALQNYCAEIATQAEEKLAAERRGDEGLAVVVRRYIKQVQAALASAEPSCVRWLSDEGPLDKGLQEVNKQIRELCRVYSQQRGKMAGLISESKSAKESLVKSVEASDHKLIEELEKWKLEAETANGGGGEAPRGEHGAPGGAGPRDHHVDGAGEGGGGGDPRARRDGRGSGGGGRAGEGRGGSQRRRAPGAHAGVPAEPA